MSYKINLVFLFFFQTLVTFSQTYTIDTIQYLGTSNKIVNLVILGDGYTKDEQIYFLDDAKRFTNYFFNTEPFKQYSNYFNVFAIETISPESGAIHLNTGDDCPHEEHQSNSKDYRFNKFSRNHKVPVNKPNNLFESTFDVYGIHRLVVPLKEDLIDEVLANHIPNHSQVVILVNSPYYGGSGGKYATATVNAKSNDIAVHEIGHSFGLLADEYWAGNQYLYEGPNKFKISDPDTVPWSHWIGTNGVGVYAYGANNAPANWYRPHEYCKMQYLSAPFCSICQEIFVETIHEKTNPIVKITPNKEHILQADSINKFALKLLKPSPNTLKVEWLLNNKKIAENIDSLYLNKGLLKQGNNELKVQVYDTTALVRVNSHREHIYDEVWNISSPVKYNLQTPIITWGNSLETCYNTQQVITIQDPQAGVVYRWYSDAYLNDFIKETTNFVTPKLTKNTTFFVVAYANDQASKPLKVTVKVLNKLDDPRKIVIKKEGNAYKITINDKKEKGIEYLWMDEKGRLISKESSINNEHILNSLEDGNKVFIKKYNTESTCTSDWREVVLN